MGKLKDLLMIGGRPRCKAKRDRRRCVLDAGHSGGHVWPRGESTRG